ncbi:MAG: hypothetical protein JJT96_19480 [Opitutales bacterium]|nr:hypothetical protein [Opitutales bacterium]
MASLLQLKATQHVWYARQAIERYPEVDVVVPKELAVHLEVIGLTEAIGNGVGGDYVIAPLSNEGMQKLIETHALTNESLLDCIDGVPVVTLAVCGLQGVRAERGERMERFGQLAGPRCLLMGAALMASPLITPVGGVLLVVGAGFVRARGQQRRLLLDHLNGLLRKHKAIVAERRRLKPPIFYKIRLWLMSFWWRQPTGDCITAGAETP